MVIHYLILSFTCASTKLQESRGGSIYNMAVRSNFLVLIVDNLFLEYGWTSWTDQDCLP